jgi:hypothetical protein
MQAHHIGALICFSIALLLYIAGAQVGGVGLAFLGFIFEVMAWRKAGGKSKD